MARFIQIIEFTTSRPEAVKSLLERFREQRRASGEAVPVIRGTTTADRDRPGVYLNIVEFASYEEAMANSKRPETSEFAGAMAELCEGSPRFYNVDVLDVFGSMSSQEQEPAPETVRA